MSSPYQLTAAYITDSGVLLGTDTGRQNIVRFVGPFTRVSANTVRNCSGLSIQLVDLEGSSFLLPRTREWLRKLR
jgi:hypothetical protein